MNLQRWDRFIESERSVIVDALRIYLEEIAGNCVNAEVAKNLRAELETLRTFTGDRA